jgi:hypothetical protein
MNQPSRLNQTRLGASDSVHRGRSQKNKGLSVEEYLVLGVSLLAAAAMSITGLVLHQTVWKERRRRRLERQHFRNKLQ